VIDIHSHILPDLDDGSTSLEQSIYMLEMAQSNGVTDIILTPHCSVMFPNFYGKALSSSFQQLKDKARDIPINLYLGQENYATDNLLHQISRKRSISLNFSKYFLVEFSFSPTADPLWITYMLKQISRLGYVPVIAHPERYPYVIEFPQMLFDWVSSGALAQINSGSIIGNLGGSEKSTAMRLLEHKLVHFVASDCHNTSSRKPNLSKAYGIVSDCFHPDYANLLFNVNPKRIITNEDVIIPKPIPFF